MLSCSYDYLCTVIHDFLYGVIDFHLQIHEAITELTPSIFEESCSSDKELHIRRHLFDRTYTGHKYMKDVLFS